MVPWRQPSGAAAKEAVRKTAVEFLETIKVISWNASNPASDVMEEVMNSLKERVGLGIVGLQEVKNWHAGQAMKDYVFIGGEEPCRQ